MKNELYYARHNELERTMATYEFKTEEVSQAVNLIHGTAKRVYDNAAKIADLFDVNPRDLKGQLTNVLKRISESGKLKPQPILQPRNTTTVAQWFCSQRTNPKRNLGISESVRSGWRCAAISRRRSTGSIRHRKYCSILTM